jgi:ABC-type transport system involved in cytochrome c biogenesis ATPase subunit
MPTTQPLLQAEEISFGHLPAPAPLLFERLNLSLAPGVSWLGGGESSGKTTLLQLLAGQLSASGQLQIQGVTLAQDAPAYRRQVAWLDPRDGALDALTCRQIFSEELPRRHPGFSPDALAAHIDGLSLAPHLDKTLTMLSTGTRRKALMAAVLAAQAPLTLLDQPFMALDRPSITYLLALLDEAARHPSRAWVVADYEAPEGVALAGVIALGAGA